MTGKVNLAEKLSLFSEHWSPKIVGELNGQEVRLAKVQGEFLWHSHEDADELFLVIEGCLTIQLRDDEIVLEPGELFIVPRGVEHRPVAAEETSILMVETAGTRNTGDVAGERTLLDLERL